MSDTFNARRGVEPESRACAHTHALAQRPSQSKATKKREAPLN